jgi:peptide/nickel transport system permease protein
MALVGMVVMAILIVGALVGPLLSPYDIYRSDLERIERPPSFDHPMGTDDLGRDELTRVCAGGRITLLIGLMAAGLSIAVGCVAGSFAGYYGGLTDSLLMRLTDMLISFPQLLLMMLFASLVGKNLVSIAVVIGSLSWMGIARLVRVAFLWLKEEDFTLAARSIGATDWQIMARHILPNAMGPVFVAGTLCVAQAIITESALSYLGLGVQQPTATWGGMLRLAQDQLASATWLSVFPGLMIVISVLSLNFIGDGMRDALDPRHLLK